MRLQIGYPHNQDMPTKREKTEHQTEQQERLKTSTHSAAQVNHNFPPVVDTSRFKTSDQQRTAGHNDPTIQEKTI